MRSAFAVFLRGFTLPFGAVGQRIVFDGIAGTIEFRDAADQLTAIAGVTQGYQVFDPGGGSAFLLAGGLHLDSGDPDQIVSGRLVSSVISVDGARRLRLRLDGGQWSPPSNAGVIVDLFSESFDGTTNPVPFVNIDAANVADADLRLNGNSLPRGLIHAASDTGASPALAVIGTPQTLPGTSFTIVNNSGMTRRYKVTAAMQVNQATATAGLYRPLVTDGATAAVGPGIAQFRTSVAGGAGQEGAHDIAIVTLTAGASQTVGAGGLRAAGGAATDVVARGEIIVEDVGGP